MGCFVCVKDKTDSTAGIEDPVYSYVGSCNYESQKNTWHQEMELEKWSVMRYNSSQLKGMWFLGCSTLLSILNLHFDIRDSYILERMSGLQRVEGRCLSADAHLALLGVNYSGNGILGLRKIKKQREIAASFHVTGNSEEFPLRGFPNDGFGMRGMFRFC